MGFLLVTKGFQGISDYFRGFQTTSCQDNLMLLNAQTSDRSQLHLQLNEQRMGCAWLNKSLIKKRRFKGRQGSQEQKFSFKLCLSSMSFLCTKHLKRVIAVTTKINAVICEKNDVINLNLLYFFSYE